MLDTDKMDADYLQNELYRLGAKDTALRKSGICSHGWFKGGSNGATCLHCGKEFKSEADLFAERDEVLFS